MKAKDVMSQSVHTIAPLASIRVTAARMRDLDVGFLPVVDNANGDTLLGVVTDRDLVVRGLAIGEDRDLAVRFVMTSQPLIVAREDTEVHALLDLMERHQVRRLPILSASGRLTGVVSQGDLALHLGPIEPEAIEELLERVSAPSWVYPQANGLIPNATSRLTS